PLRLSFPNSLWERTPRSSVSGAAGERICFGGAGSRNGVSRRCVPKQSLGTRRWPDAPARGRVASLPGVSGLGTVTVSADLLPFQTPPGRNTLGSMSCGRSSIVSTTAEPPNQQPKKHFFTTPHVLPSPCLHPFLYGLHGLHGLHGLKGLHGMSGQTSH